MQRAAVDADDRDLECLGRNLLEQLGRKLRLRGLEHGEAIGRELGAHDVVQLDRELMRRIEQRVAAGLEHPLEPAVARQEGALAVLDRDAQREQVPVHNTSPSLARAAGAAETGLQFSRGLGSGRALPGRTAGRGLSLR